MDENGKPNFDIISIIGYRTPFANLENYSIYPLYNETITIQTKNGIISAQSLYSDPRLGFSTELPSVEYSFTTASGEFVGSKILTIYFDNINKTRRVEITG